MKRSKCAFATSSVAYLGHVIFASSIAMDSDKVVAMVSWPQPASAHGLCSFLGLVGYYQCLIMDFGTLAAPLTQLLRKEFHWTEATTAVFTMLKEALTAAPMLYLPNFTKPFMVDCDASDTSFGAVLH